MPDTPNLRSTRLIGAVLALVVGVAGCSSRPSPSVAARSTEPPAVSASASTGSVRSGIPGYYTLYLDSQRAAVDRYEIGGPWVADIYGDGRVTMQGPARDCCTLDARYTTEGDQLTVKGATEYDHCKSPGVYTLETTEQGVRFSVVHDACLVRAMLFAEAWHYEGPPS